jgi:hypothetical protein
MTGTWWAEAREGRWQVQTAHRGPGSSFCIAPVNHWTDNAGATARLIAAAPELAEALEALHDRIMLLLNRPHAILGGELVNEIAAARAALAKAKGETP